MHIYEITPAPGKACTARQVLKESAEPSRRRRACVCYFQPPEVPGPRPVLVAAEHKIDSRLQACPQRVACVKYDDFIGTCIRDAYQVVVHRHYLSLGLRELGQGLFHPQVLPIAYLALVPVRPCGAQGKDYGVVKLVDLL